MSLEDEITTAMRLASDAGVDIDSDDDIVSVVEKLISQRDAAAAESVRNCIAANQRLQEEVELNKKVDAFQKQEIARLKQKLESKCCDARAERLEASAWQLACFASYVAGVKVFPNEATMRYVSDLRESLDDLHADALLRDLGRTKHGYPIWFMSDEYE